MRMRPSTRFLLVVSVEYVVYGAMLVSVTVSAGDRPSELTEFLVTMLYGMVSWGAFRRVPGVMEILRRDRS